MDRNLSRIMEQILTGVVCVERNEDLHQVPPGTAIHVVLDFGQEARLSERKVQGLHQGISASAVCEEPGIPGEIQSDCSQELQATHACAEQEKFSQGTVRFDTD